MILMLPYVVIKTGFHSMRTVKLLFPFLRNIFVLSEHKNCLVQMRSSFERIYLNIMFYIILAFFIPPIYFPFLRIQSRRRLCSQAQPVSSIFGKHFKPLLNFHFQVSVLINLCHISFHLCKLNSSYSFSALYVFQFCVLMKTSQFSAAAINFI